MASAGPANPEQVAAKVKTLINSQLKQVLKKEGLPVSGAKATLQSRITEQLFSYARNNNVDAFSRLRSLVYYPDGNIVGPSPTSTAARSHPQSHLPPPSKLHYPPTHNNSSFGQGAAGMPQTMNGIGPRTPQFKQSPFYSVLEPLTPVLECKAVVRDTTRDTVEATINLRPDIADSLSGDKSIRAIIYCAADAMSPFSRVDIEFPYQLEIKINQDEVKANLRGLKNKPGTTRPADVSGLLRAKAGYSNHMVVTYALTKKKYFMVVNLVKCHPVHELVAKLRSGKTISKEQVVREMKSRAEDADIVLTSSIMSLKCPLSTLRIDVPCRSSTCAHNQCFDATSFLQLQEQAPTWTCPVCNKIAAYEHLQVDQYVADILKSTPKSIDQVTIEPDGKWLQTSDNAPSRAGTTNGRASSDGEEDLVEIPRMTSVKSEITRDQGLMRTPPVSSREQSTSSALPPAQKSSNKRSAGQVVDLTFSSDEDEEPPRAAKMHKSSADFPKLSHIGDVPLRPNGMARTDSSNSFNMANGAPKGYNQPLRG